ncbi:hypothetical protein N7519_002266 [Penicillium mononematosum]|uniref:uncharacterized protein n=1 Tax=Penicillium mononematosum TaxID=268346 RepID=UPI0025477B24|nr:uncharacterized protein N7519_002266 [Penicillium mononematosum]KAJ6187358.1 hypothetical protein N7519_002266 [Penicillium mononematosum]
MDSTEIHQTTVVDHDEPMTDNFNDNLADQGDLEAPLKTEEEYAIADLTLRAIVSSKEAGVIIGKAGKNVADLRDETGVKAGVSKVVPGVHDRVLTVTGQLRSLARAYAIVAKGLLEGAPQMGMGGIVSNNGTHRYPEGIEKAIWEIGKCLLDDWQRGTGTVLYNPAVRASLSGSQPLSNNPPAGNGYQNNTNSRQYNRTGNGADFSDGGYNRRSNSDAGNRGYPLVTEDGEEIQTQNISIPADMITEIRRSSGARISIAKAPHDETGERMFTIMGSALANEKALYLLYENLEAEKTRRSQLPQE